jgi:PAS domain S-box-containing protein
MACNPELSRFANPHATFDGKRRGENASQFAHLRPRTDAVDAARPRRRESTPADEFERADAESSSARKPCGPSRRNGTRVQDLLIDAGRESRTVGATTGAGWSSTAGAEFGAASRRGREDAPPPSQADHDGRAAMFATVFHQSPDGLIVVDARDGTIIEANRAVRHALGYEPRWLIGVPFAALQGDQSGAPLQECVERQGAVVEDQELRRIDGSLCPVHLRASLADWGERPVIIVALRDVRERCQAQEARRRAEERFRSIFDNTIEGIFQTTPDGRYIAANPALARIYGYDSADELMARLTDIAGQLYVDPQRRAEFRRLLERTGVVQGFESQIHRKDASITWISENARAVRDAQGALLYYEGTVIDIATRKAAEAAQRVEAEVASALARVGEEMIASIDSPQILDRLCQLTAEVLACDWSQALLWEPEDDVYVAAAIASATAPAGPPDTKIPRRLLTDLLQRLERAEVALLDADACRALPPELLPAGQPCRAALYFAIRRGGVGVGVLMAGYRVHPDPFTHAQVRIARGVAHLAALALEHARLLDALARANRLKSEFVATMSHELRTPLNIILGYNDLLQERSFGALTPEQAEILVRVGRSGQELLELINATLDLSRLEAGRLTVDLAVVALDPLMRQIDDEARELLRERPELALRWDLAFDSPVLRTDAGKLKVILKNLITNAVKFTERGEVRVRGRTVSTGLELTVSDTGIGIAPEALPIIFEAFRQADSSMTRRYGGVGLGLHVVQRLVDLLGGTVDVHSTVGVGSTFRVCLPVL